MGSHPSSRLPRPWRPALPAQGASSTRRRALSLGPPCLGAAMWRACPSRTCSPCSTNSSRSAPPTRSGSRPRRTGASAQRRRPRSLAASSLSSSTQTAWPSASSRRWATACGRPRRRETNCGACSRTRPRRCTSSRSSGTSWTRSSRRTTTISTSSRPATCATRSRWRSSPEPRPKLTRSVACTKPCCRRLMRGACGRGRSSGAMLCRSSRR
mmetsp:Transcript_1047/g.3219  ORF Transcript_1047/g.3219 Transcript_1047/m.3219 type:complete len:212 (-) Transcript_1047:927-1562(-)